MGRPCREVALEVLRSGLGALNLALSIPADKPELASLLAAEVNGIYVSLSASSVRVCSLWD